MEYFADTPRTCLIKGKEDKHFLFRNSHFGEGLKIRPDVALYLLIKHLLSFYTKPTHFFQTDTQTYGSG